MQARQDMMQRSTDFYSCSINNLPFELLSLVFEISAASRRVEDEKNHYSPRDPYPLPHHPPFEIVVSHVCQYWRRVAFQTPRLWSTLFFRRLSRPAPEFISLRIERSNPQPIDISISPAKRWISDDPSTFPYHLILPHVHRWRSLKVTFHRKDHELTFLESLSQSTVSAAFRLETVVLRVEDHCSGPSTSKRFGLFDGSAPRLTTIILWGVLVDWNQSWISSAVNLTTLELGYHKEHNRPSWAQFSAILRGAPALKRLVLCSSGPFGMPREWVTKSGSGDATSTDLDSPIPLLSLGEFLLALDRPTRAIGFLRKFCMPALKHLSLDLRDADCTDFVRELAGPATTLAPRSVGERPARSLPSHLEELAIFHLPSHPDVQKLLYDELECVKTLRIPMDFRPNHASEFVPLLLPCHQAEDERCSIAPVPLPRLEDLTVYFDCYNYLLVREVIRERKRVGFPVRSLSLGKAYGLSEELETWFGENVDKFTVARTGHDP